MRLFSKIIKIIRESVPVLIMIGFIPLVMNDYLLTLIYVGIVILALLIKREKGDLVFLIVGFLVMMVFEYIFVSTGVETFLRNSLFGLMPLWLPFLWAYGFVVLRRSVKILEI